MYVVCLTCVSVLCIDGKNNNMIPSLSPYPWSNNINNISGYDYAYLCHMNGPHHNNVRQGIRSHLGFKVVVQLLPIAGCVF